MKTVNLCPGLQIFIKQKQIKAIFDFDSILILKKGQFKKFSQELGHLLFNFTASKYSEYQKKLQFHTCSTNSFTVLADSVYFDRIRIQTSEEKKTRLRS
jgi:hypothetical protein